MKNLLKATQITFTEQQMAKYFRWEIVVFKKRAQGVTLGS